MGPSGRSPRPHAPRACVAVGDRPHNQMDRDGVPDRAARPACSSAITSSTPPRPSWSCSRSSDQLCCDRSTPYLSAGAGVQERASDRTAHGSIARAPNTLGASGLVCASPLRLHLALYRMCGVDLVQARQQPPLPTFRLPIEGACTYHGLQLLFQHHLERQPDRALKQLAIIA